MRAGAASVIPAVAAVLLFAANAFGQPESPPKIRDNQKLMHVLETSLHNEIPGVVEGVIYDMVEYKSYYPNLDFSSLIDALDDAAKDSKDSAIAYKAHVASMYLSFGSTLDGPEAFNPENHEHAFQLAAEQLEKKFLLSRATE